MSEQAAKEVQQAIKNRLEGFSIELGCAPGHVRPGDLIEAVIAGTGLPSREPVSKVFGDWTYDYSDLGGIDKLWTKIKPILQERICALYVKGTIRYGSW